MRPISETLFKDHLSSNIYLSIALSLSWQTEWRHSLMTRINKHFELH